MRHIHPLQLARLRAWGGAPGARPEFLQHHDPGDGPHDGHEPHGGHPGHGGPFGRGRRGWGAGFGPGFGPAFGFGAGFGPGSGPGTGPRGWGGPRGPRARRGDVRAAVLVLLQDGPKHGYQLITEFEQRTEGRWKPSPGSVYPVLQQLADEGLVRPEEVDGRRLFHLTDGGRAAAQDAATRHGERLWGEDDRSAGTPGPLMDTFMGLAGASWQVLQSGDPAQAERARVVLEDARKALYRILAEDRDPQA